jgi:DNA polymerase III alpha subunit
MPDIDLDIASNDREEVIQYVYQKYGERYAAMVCNVVTYRARSASREVAKALGFRDETVDRMAKSIDQYNVDPRAYPSAARHPAYTTEYVRPGPAQGQGPQGQGPLSASRGERGGARPSSIS